MRRKSPLLTSGVGHAPLLTPLRDTPPLLTSCAGHAHQWRPTSISHLPSENHLPPLPSKEGPRGSFSPLPWLEGDRQVSTLTPQRLPCPGQLPVAPRLCAERCSASLPPEPQGHLFLRAFTPLRPDPGDSELTANRGSKVGHLSAGPA